MISSEDVRHVTFDKAFQGYRREDVDDYLKQVAQAMDDLAAQNDDLQKKLVMLAQRIEKYRTMENSLSTSMINAQRMGDSIIRESKQKAAEIIRSANIKAEDREQRARDDVELAKQEIVTLKGEADSFKRSLIEMYRKHINLINKLPDYTRRPEDEPVPPPSPAPEQAAAPAAEPQEPAPVREEPPVQETVSLPEQVTLEPPHEAPWRIAGEVLRTYIICEDGDGSLWLIDKHAAHERLRFDALKESAAPPMAQPLLTPAAVRLTAEEYTAVLDDLPLLEQCGFLCEDFGDGTVLVREIPADLRPEDASATLEELAHKLLLHTADQSALRDELLHTVACKSAIKAGMHTDPAELQALVDKVQSGAVRYCPHGRPVAVEMTRYQIEKMFKRA